MKAQHLSDEAVAAYADGVLGGTAQDRASRHVRDCAECRAAVRVQREAASVLRAAPAPPLPSSLAARLRSVPMTTSISTLPTAIGPDGAPMLATFGTASLGTAAALVPTRPDPAESTGHHWGKPIAMTVALVALAGGLTAGSVADASVSAPTQHGTGHFVRAGHSTPADAPQVVNQVRQFGDHRP